MNIPKYLIKSNRFVVDCDLILEYATNSINALKDLLKKYKLEEVLFDASGYTLNTSSFIIIIAIIARK